MTYIIWSPSHCANHHPTYGIKVVYLISHSFHPGPTPSQPKTFLHLGHLFVGRGACRCRQRTARRPRLGRRRPGSPLSMMQPAVGAPAARRPLELGRGDWEAIMVRWACLCCLLHRLQVIVCTHHQHTGLGGAADGPRLAPWCRQGVHGCKPGRGGCRRQGRQWWQAQCCCYRGEDCRQ